MLTRFSPIATLQWMIRCCVLPVLTVVMAASALAAELTIAVSRTPLSLPFYVAQERGLFKDEGLDVRVVDCVASPQCFTAMHEGKADLATVADLPVMFNSFERRDWALLATFVNSSNDLKLVARKSAGIAAAKDLAGILPACSWGRN